jgi:L-amino acid N-acyltransferase YncA
LRLITVRPAWIGDASSIAYVQVESWKTTYAGIVPDDYLTSLTVESRTESWKEQLDAGTSSILVAEDTGGVFGFVSGGKLRGTIDGYDAELYAIYLLHPRQRCGVGRTLVAELAKDLRAKGFRSLIAWVLVRNPSINFYTRLGAVQVAEKNIQIGAAQLKEVAMGWPSLDHIA